MGLQEEIDKMRKESVGSESPFPQHLISKQCSLAQSVFARL
jgi:hypothetical protein